MRIDGRKNDELREIKVEMNYTKHAEGSVLFCIGDTKVICNATIESKVPPFLEGKGKGWVTAEYDMLPRATNTRNQRDINKLKRNNRSVEISRLIGRALRMAVDLDKLGEHSIIVDCDVIQADGGTRTASISGGFIALALACRKLLDDGKISENPIKSFISAISVGVFEGKPLLDLCYTEDSACDVDMNIVLCENGDFAELQGTGEKEPFSQEKLTKMIEYANKGCMEIIEIQKNLLIKG